MPSFTFLPGFGFVWRLIRFTPSTINRFLSGSTRSTRPRLPRSLPVITSTLSFLRIGVAKLDISLSRRAGALQDLRRERNDLHEPALAQFAGDGTEHAGADGLVLIVDQHGRVAIEADVAAVAPALLLDGADDHRLHNRALLGV